MEEVLSVEGLSSGYGSSAVINRVSCSVAAGEVLALVGKNGMGKTSLLKAILGFLPAWAGRITLAGHNVTRLPPHQKRRLGLIHVPQEQALFQDLTVRENLRLGLLTDQDLAAGLEQITGWFPVLTRRLSQRAGTLSGGEQKMLIVARALIARPRLLLLDEVTEGLQPSVVDRMAEVLSEIRMQHGTAMLVVEQHIPFVLAIADRYMVLKRGEIVDSGRADPAAADIIDGHMRL
jgi:branched-chain amino acid transport system ATP-binding protein